MSLNDVPPLRSNIPIPGVQFRAAVSEYLAQSLAGTMNFINYFQHSEKQFFLNGPYSLAPTVPQIGVDGLAVFEFNAQIIDVWMFNLVAGTSGSTSLDLQIATASGGSFTSIFTTLPAISWQAGNNTWVGTPNPALIGSAYTPPTYTPPLNTTQPVLNSALTNLIPAGTAIQCNLQSVQAGGENTGILVHYRPV